MHHLLKDNIDLKGRRCMRKGGMIISMGEPNKLGDNLTEVKLRRDKSRMKSLEVERRGPTARDVSGTTP
jgi:hypothetical protein